MAEMAVQEAVPPLGTQAAVPEQAARPAQGMPGVDVLTEDMGSITLEAAVVLDL